MANEPQKRVFHGKGTALEGLPDLGEFLQRVLKEGLYIGSTDQQMDKESVEDDLGTFLEGRFSVAEDDLIDEFVLRVVERLSDADLKQALEMTWVEEDEDGQLALIAAAIYRVALASANDSDDRRMAQECFTVPFAEIVAMVGKHQAG